MDSHHVPAEDRAVENVNNENGIEILSPHLPIGEDRDPGSVMGQ